MLSTSARLLRLLSLLQSRRFWSGAELADRLGVTERSVRRDVERLRELGYPVHSTSGVAGGYQLGAGSALPPLLLDDDEATAVVVGLRSATAGTLGGAEEAALRALAKLEQVLPPRLRRRVGALAATIVPMHRTSPVVNQELLIHLAQACRDREVVRFGYGDRKAQATVRTVEPHGLVHSGLRWYLVAWDLDRADWRTFRIDRVTGKVASLRRFVPRQIPGGDLAAYVSRSVGVEAYRHSAEVILHAPVEELRQRVSPLVGRLEKIDAERTRFTTGGPDLGSLALHVAMLGVEFDVVHPPELLDHVRDHARRLTRTAERACGSR